MKKSLIYCILITTFVFLLVLNLFPASSNQATEIDKEALKKLQEQKVVRAYRTVEPIELDGYLNENVWKNPAISDFLQSDPVDGEKASEKTEVWVAYDDSNLYVAAYCYDSDSKGIIGLLGRRDSHVDSDWFIFYVDPYFDRRSGYSFWVNPAGSIVDAVLFNDVAADESWDGIWEVRTQRTGDGWTVEIRLPFNQLRFSKKDFYVWGVNVERIIKRKNEKIFFAWIPKEDNAFVSRFARLEGIEKIIPGRRVEFFPYTLGHAQFQPAEPGNPFETGHKYQGNAGFDLKLGLRSNLNLDLTVNPDFGQVEVDPAVINLTAYETYYEEKRPFFIEGASIFDNFGRGGVYLNANVNWSNPRFFYSRRIGRAPQGYVIHDGYVNFPDRSTILGAFKLTGKVGSAWNIGFISALTGREFATVDDLTNQYEEEVEPLTYYGILRAQKDIKDGQQGIGFIATGVIRDIRSETIDAILNRNAFSLAVDGWSFLDRKRVWVVGGWIGRTFIQGSQEDIFWLQQSSIHYFQRPDATHLGLDPEATSLSGWGTRLNLARQQGHSLILFSAGALSPGFDPNDAGFQRSSSDIIDIQGLYAYQWTKPGRFFRRALLIGGFNRDYDFGGNKIFDAWLASFQGVLTNWWSFENMVIYMRESLSNNLTRGGPLALIPHGFQIESVLTSDSRRPVVLQGEISFSKFEEKSTGWSADFSVRWKPRTNFSLSVGPLFGKEINETQWVIKVADDLMTETYGNRYIFGRIDRKIVAGEIRMNWIFTPKLSLQVYLQPFIAVGKYDRFKQLSRSKAYDYFVFGDTPSSIALTDDRYTVDPDGDGPAAKFSFCNPDFNYKSLRGTIVLRWEYKPGSLIYLVWTQNRADYSHPGDFSLGRDLGALFTVPGDNIFLFKISYRLNL